MLDRFFHENSTQMRLLRTIVQGILSVIIANLDILTGMVSIDPTIKPIIVASLMAILSPIMSEIGKYTDSTSTIKSEG